MASRGINKVILIGHLGQDPDVRYMTSGEAVANVTLATSETWKDKNTGEQREKTEWHRLVFYRRLAEIVGEYIKKGSKIYVEGRLQTREWLDQQGAKRYTTEIVVNDMQMLDGRGDNQHNGAYQQTTPPDNQQQNNIQQQPPFNNTSSNQGKSAPVQQQPYQPAPAQQMPQYNEPSMDFDDDIPF